MAKYDNLSDIITLKRVAEFFHDYALDWVLTSDICDGFRGKYNEEISAFYGRSNGWLYDNEKEEVDRRIKYRLKKLKDRDEAIVRDWAREHSWRSNAPDREGKLAAKREREKEALRKRERRERAIRRARLEEKKILEDLMETLELSKDNRFTISHSDWNPDGCRMKLAYDVATDLLAHALKTGWKKPVPVKKKVKKKKKKTKKKDAA